MLFITVDHHTIPQYFEAPTAEKPWILCEIFITRGMSPSQDEIDAGKSSDVPAPTPSHSDIDNKLDPKDRDDPLSKHEKSVFVMQSILCRIRCPPCKPPRFNPQLMDDKKVFTPLWLALTDWDMSNRTDYPPSDIECKNLLLRPSARPVFQQHIKSEEREKALAGWTEDTQALYLLPHFEVSYDLSQPTHIMGINWEEEHKIIVRYAASRTRCNIPIEPEHVHSTLRIANPSIPENAYIPVKVFSETAVRERRWCIEDPDFIDRNHVPGNWNTFVQVSGGEEHAYERMRLLNREGVRKLYHPRQKTLIGRVRREQPHPWGLQRTDYLEAWEELNGVEKPTDAFHVFAPSDAVKEADKVMLRAAGKLLTLTCIVLSDRRTVVAPATTSLRSRLSAALFAAVCGLLHKRTEAPSVDDDKLYVPFTKSWKGLRSPCEETPEIRRRNFRD